MYLEACLQQRRHFSPFVASVDGLMGVEAMATLKRIASRLYDSSVVFVRSDLAGLGFVLLMVRPEYINGSSRT